MSSEANAVDLTAVDLTKIGFASEIRRIATTLSREPTAEQTSALENVLQQAAVLGEDKKIAIVTDTGAVPVTDYIAASLAHLAPVAAPVDKPAPAVTHPTVPSWTRGRSDTLATLGRSFAAAEQAASLAAALDGPNPWAAGHVNRTKQAIIRNLNPALAAELKIKARAS